MDGKYKFRKHAFLIMAHDNPEMLSFLVAKLDYEYNDIFIHIDKKSDMSLFSDIKTTFSTLYFTPPEDRVDVRWGDMSQVECEYVLFKQAYHTSSYAYFHLLSGVDMPLKSNEYIHRLFDVLYKGREFVSVSFTTSCLQSLVNHTQYYFLFNSILKSNMSLVNRIKGKVRSYVIRVQQKIGFKRTFDIELVKGHNWNSITNDACGYLIKREKYIMRKMRYVCCPDEIFLQTLLWNSPFRDKFVSVDGENEYTSLRHIDWERGTPYIWSSSDYEELAATNAIFARKFSSADYMFVDSIINDI